MRPLDALGSIKLKLGAVIVAAVIATIAVVLAGERLELSPVVTGILAIAIAVAMVRFLAHGMTYPLREMVDAAQAMARGDYSRRVTATSRDEVGQLARAFNTMAGELAEVDRMRRDLVANASHELRTPIGALQAKLENLVDGVEPLNAKAAEAALDQVERLATLVEQLLHLSKLESGAVDLELRPVSASAMLRGLAAEWSATASTRAVRLRVDVDPASLELRIDERRLRQVLQNLIANAVRHAPPASEVVMRARPHAPGVRLEVIDSGSGIAPDEAERVFERFYRSDRARATDEGGVGLGLAIARWIVDLHGGRISVDPRRTDGCTIVVDLP